jgi:superfamily II DNA helicase RecQ
MPRPRCPNGSRKNKNGVCVINTTKVKSTSKKRESISKIFKSRCQKGYRKNKSGECVSNNTTKKRKMSERETPRTSYANRYFKNNTTSIHLLDKLEQTQDNVMFQVNYNDVSQFTNHVNLSHNPRIDCFFQSIFSLGLRDVKMAKHESTNININGKVGVDTDEIKLFIKNAFDLAPNEYVKTDFYRLDDYIIRRKKSRDFLNKLITNNFRRRLKDGYASVIYVERLYNNGMRNGHFIIVYRHNNIIYYFDPQKNIKDTKAKGAFNSTDIYEVLDTGIIMFGTFTVYNLKSPKLLVNTTCPVRYVE